MGISVTKLLILLAIIVVIFGTKRLRTIGTDLGDAIRNFRSAVKSGEEESPSEQAGNADAVNGELLDKQTEKTEKTEKTEHPSNTHV